MLPYSSLVSYCMGLCDSWTLVSISLLMLMKFSVIISPSFSGNFCLPLLGPQLIWMFSEQCCPRRSSISSVLFSFILFLYSVLWQWFPPFYLLAYLFILLPKLLLGNRFLLAYFHFHLLHCFLSVCFKSFSSLLNISCLFFICASILFLRFWVIFTIITVHSFFKLTISSSFSSSCEFYFVTSFAVYFSVVSFCLTICVHGLLSANCGIVVPLASECLPPPAVRLVQGLLQEVGRTFLPSGRWSWIYFLWCEGPCEGCVWGSCELSMSLGL